jgi:hypothetical protein
MTVRVVTTFHRDIASPVIGLLIRNRLGMDVFGTNTRIERIDLGELHAGESLAIDFALNCSLARQEYTLTVAAQYADGLSQDWLDDAVTFTVVDSKDLAGVIDLRPEITWRKFRGDIRDFLAEGQTVHGHRS